MSARVLSTNVGTAMDLPGVRRPSGIGKEPVAGLDVADPGPKRVEGGAGVSGVAGDHIGNGRHHGGSRQAVYAFAREELDHWERELGRPILNGFFGENLTVTGYDVDAAEVGDRWQVGTAQLVVTGPRVPCATFAARMGVRGWVRRFAERGLSGAYLAVASPGRIEPGDALTVERSGSGVALPTLLAGWLGDRSAAASVVDAPALDPESRERLRTVLRD